jgi:hypothetical protein
MWISMQQAKNETQAVCSELVGVKTISDLILK